MLYSSAQRLIEHRRRHMQRFIWVSFVVALLAAQAYASDTGIGYPTVAAAHKALMARSDVSFSYDNGWARAEDRNAKTVWLFALKDHPAYPTAVRMRTVEQDGATGTETRVMCRSTKAACERIADTFHGRDAGAGK
jgi:hypothetical protein